MADISKITLPSGNTYDIKDAVAREAISGGVSFIIAWAGTNTPVVADIPYGVTVTYNNTNYTGTLSADSATPGAFYLVKSATTPSGETLDKYDEYVPVGTTGAKTWEKIGDTQLNLTDVVTDVSLSKQTDVVLGEDTTFALTSGTVTVTPTTTNIKATAEGGNVAWNSKDQKTVVTGYTIAAANKDTFVKSVTAETNKKMVTTSITPTNGTETVSKVTKTASKLVTTTVPNVTSAGSASTWSFTMGSGNAAETLIISGGNSTAPTLGTAKTVATGGVAADGGGSDIVTAVTISDKTVAKQGSAVTVATGATATDGTGAAVVTGVTIGDSADAIVSLPSPSTANVIGASSTFTPTQPTVKLTSGATAVSGSTVNVATGITSASVGTGITVGTNDRVTVLKNNTDVNVTKGNA